ncbi:DUF4333 domain-containing protein [Nocardia africana]|uniref:DUF4333 domain-containing protein n=1 Tax=Nocardia africana TaxID=134964 RepID=A0A378WV22_9NOCA|nr:DUF4333 domain-containing protein [Nocardia africana]MCC3313919.1 DUF4333 domain-containing protein [Nocardia africana]SUA44692.1 Uncharacterised protein [Nocardia africana]
MSGPYGPNETPGPGEGHSGDPAQQWSGQPQPGQSGPAPQWGGQQPQQPQWGQPAPSQQQWAPQPQQPQQPQWGGQSQPSWPQQPPAQAQPWEPTQQQWSQPQQPSQQQWAQQQPTQQGWAPQPDQSQQQWGMQEPQLSTTPAKKSKKGLLFGGIGLLVVVVVAVVLAFVFLGSDKLDNKAVQDGVQKVLKDSYGIDDVQNVSCPSGQKVEVGGTFDCTLKVGGEQKKVTVKITKDDGTYEVGRPN